MRACGQRGRWVGITGCGDNGRGRGGDQPTGHAGPSLVPTTGIIAGPEGTALDGAPQTEQVPVGGLDTGVALEPAEKSGAATET